MADVVKIASYICLRYRQQFGREIDEMKLHKLLYFTQRESIIQTGEPLFEDRFEAWKYGPVMVSIRWRYRNHELHEQLSSSLLKNYRPVFDMVFDTYAQKDSWSLSSITHGEHAWQEARQKVTAEKRHVLINTDDIRKDAERVHIRRLIYDKANTLMKKTDNHANNC